MITITIVFIFPASDNILPASDNILKVPIKVGSNTILDAERDVFVAQNSVTGSINALFEQQSEVDALFQGTNFARGGGGMSEIEFNESFTNLKGNVLKKLKYGSISDSLDFF